MNREKYIYIRFISYMCGLVFQRKPKENPACVSLISILKIIEYIFTNY